MFEFIIALLLFGKGDVNDNWHVYAGQDPRNHKVAPVVAPVVAIEYTQRF